MWKGGLSSGFLKLIPHEFKNELASIYFRLECHNYESEKVRYVSILAATTQEKPKAQIDAKLSGKAVIVETPWTHAELLHSELVVRLKKSEKTLRKDIDSLLKKNYFHF